MRPFLFYKDIPCSTYLLIIFFFFSSCAPFMLNKHYSGQTDTAIVRVLLLKTKASFTISSESPISISGATEQIITHDNPSNNITLNPDKIVENIKIEPGNSPLVINGQPYRGSVELRCVNGTAYVINILKIDEYLVSVVPGEIPATWEDEALKAQAVAARTYTYYHIITNRKSPALYDLDATTNSQVYKGIIDEKPRTSEAVLTTAGEIIIYDERPILSYFHSTCGGKTIDDKYVWNTSHLPYLHGVTCGFCNDSTKYTWESRLSLEEIQDNLSKKYRTIGSIRNISFRKIDDRVAEVYIQHSRGNLKITGNNFRLLFPPEKVRSLYFTSKKFNAGLILTGHGWGHGVGMCQWGARGMALRGYRYQEILKHYYTDVIITSIRNRYVASKMKDPHDFQ
jgi:stage II sporulation protein D